MTLKAVAERLLMSSGAAAVTRRRFQHGALILAYHNVIPDGAASGPDASLHVPRTLFAAQLDLLIRTHDIVRLDEAVSAPCTRQRPVAAITFDDAYRGALTIGLDELRTRGLEATVFVAPGFLNGGTFWWDALSWPAALAEGDRFRARALAECGGRDADVRALARRIGYAEVDVPEHLRCVTEEELWGIDARGGITIGAHSWSHPSLIGLDRESLARELGEPLTWLRARYSNAQPWLAYPYGQWSETVVAATRDAGYRLALRAEGGWVRRRGEENELVLPRLDVSSGLSSHGFALRTSGMFCS